MYELMRHKSATHKASAQDLRQIGVAHDSVPYAKVVYKDDPSARVIESGSVGLDWQPGATPYAGLHTVKSYLGLNSASYPVRLWKSNGTTSGDYPINTVMVSITTDENGNKVRAYTNKLGQTVLKQVETTGAWLETYYIYNDYGRLKYQVSPKAVEILDGTPDLESDTPLAELIYKYTYDLRGRLIEKKVPGAALQYMVYDNLDRLVLTQDGNLRTANKWMFIKYDFQNRPVCTGIYVNTVQTTRPTVQGLADAIDLSIITNRYETAATSATYQYYTNTAFPTTGITVLAASYYDHYDFNNDATADYAYDNTHLAGLPATASNATRNRPTGSRKAILDASGNPTSWLVSVVFYDNLDRPLQTQSNNHLNALVQDKNSILYADLGGRVTKTKTTHAGATTVNTILRYSYDPAGRPLKVYQSLNNGATEQLVANYKYNALGQVVEKNLHLLYDAQDGQSGITTADDLVQTQYNNESQLVARNSITLKPGYNVKGSTTPYTARITAVTPAQAETNGRYLQSIDYRYNIRGWLSSINNAQLANDATTNDDTNDYFGMEMAYNTDAGMTNTKYYNGNISAMKWKGLGTSGAAGQRSYKYTYDKSDKLTAATFQASTVADWSKETNTLNESMSYDVNGNILTLARNYNQRSVAGVDNAQAVDNLNYTYASNTNQLIKVEDAVATTIGTGDFKNGSTAATEYNYSTDGSLTADQNKGISAITYNLLGKPQQVTFTNGNSIAYTYAADGSKLKVATTVSSVTTTTDYVDGFVYTNNALSFFSSPEGRVVKNGSNYEYQYAIADHQGNTRVLFTAATPAALPTSADMEAATNTSFQNYTNRISFDLMDHTDAGIVYTYAQKLTAASGSQVGLSKSYTVFAGDKVKIEGYAKYFNPQVAASNLSGFAAALTGAFGVTATSTGEALKAFTALNNMGGIVASGGGNSNQSGFPKLFVNILLFDRNYNLVDAAWQQIDGGEQPVGNGTKLPHDYMSAELTAKEAGFAYVYFSNENASLIEFYVDDVTMSYTPGNVIQYSEFYNHGGLAANSWTRPNTTGNNFLANGGTELNTTSQLYDLEYRNYDPILGRMNQVDPLASKFASHTPYNFAFNDPVFFNDPYGASPNSLYDKYVAPYFRPRIVDNGVGGAAGGGGYGGGDGFGGPFSGGGGSGGLFDAIWGPGGFENIGGIGLGSAAQQMNSDARNLSAQEYGAKYGTTYVPEYSYKEWVYPDGSVSYPYNVRLTGFVASQQTQSDPSPDELFKRFGRSFSEWARPIIEKYDGTSFDVKDLLNELAEFDASHLEDDGLPDMPGSANQYRLRTIWGRLDILKATDRTTITQEYFQSYPQYKPTYMGTVVSPGLGAVTMTNKNMPDALIMWGIKLEIADSF